MKSLLCLWKLTFAYRLIELVYVTLDRCLKWTPRCSGTDATCWLSYKKPLSPTRWCLLAMLSRPTTRGTLPNCSVAVQVWNTARLIKVLIWKFNILFWFHFAIQYTESYFARQYTVFIVYCDMYWSFMIEICGTRSSASGLRYKVFFWQLLSISLTTACKSWLEFFLFFLVLPLIGLSIGECKPVAAHK